MQDFCRRITEAASRIHSLGDAGGIFACGPVQSVTGICRQDVHLSLPESLAAQLTWPLPSLLPPSLVPVRAGADVAPVSGSAGGHDMQPSLPESMAAQLAQPSPCLSAPLLVPVSTDQVPCSFLAGPSLMPIPAQSSPLAQMLPLEAVDSSNHSKRGAAAESAFKLLPSTGISMEALPHKEHVARTQYGGADAIGNPGSSLLERMASCCNTARQPGSIYREAVQSREGASQSFLAGAEVKPSNEALTLQEALDMSAARPSQQVAPQKVSSSSTMKSSPSHPASLAVAGHAEVRQPGSLKPKYRLKGSRHESDIDRKSS